ncbi:type II toxin-antitoxin system Phd/YefM family antitoxin [Rahnella perminowiae]|uniref:type II toxin-antitoxin system Phd/YefM family antitoxin n=1 Tax=Rahnella TaxID=34037 RepID=UPI001C27F36E|nr:type II toxin-antitoxin system Phd/YefM family antitoxin [Rahnella aceris]MBU9849264.1 type II toxin-antitoxin system Phd/YefM family antitoxin [Rahnella aceris]MBU9858829.1 type II toxin-antitoxin system Phd/YefM family antitoxin [Rahnella aceris]
MRHITFTEARTNFADVLNQVSDDADTVVITRRGSRDVVMLDADEYSSMVETLYLFSNPANAAHIEASLAQLDSGDTVEIDV